MCSHVTESLINSRLVCFVTNWWHREIWLFLLSDIVVWFDAVLWDMLHTIQCRQGAGKRGCIQFVWRVINSIDCYCRMTEIIRVIDYRVRLTVWPRSGHNGYETIAWDLPALLACHAACLPTIPACLCGFIQRRAALAVFALELEQLI